MEKRVFGERRLVSSASICLFFALFIVSCTARKVKHPFLIVKESDYPALRARAIRSPWKEMKAEAIAYIKTHSFDPKAELRARCNQMSEITAAGALAYILDPDNKTLYKNKIADALKHWGKIHDELMAVSRSNSGHGYWVGPGTAVFNSVLALDIIYNDLTPAQRTDIEAKLDKMSDLFWKWGGWWRLNAYGVRGVWALYRDDPRIDLAIKDYRTHLYKLIGPDGVFNEGPGYAGARLGFERYAKVHFMDVLEFTGRSKFYSDPRVINFYEWLYGYSVSPFNRYCCFGDTGPNRNYHKSEPATFRAYRFSKRAAAYAAWSNDGEKPKGRLLHYVLMGQPLSKPEIPLGRIFPDGGAFFRESNPSDKSLAGALWNCKFSRYHSHKDVNAVHLAAYGEHVLLNSGYAGAGRGALGFSWKYVNHTAVSNNIVLIDGADHATKIGGGIVAGFTAPLFDYACGYSADAIGNGKHLRNFCFVHPQDDRCGYWVLFDEVKADKTSSKVNVVLHPNSPECSTTSEKQEYRWKIGPFAYSGHNVFVSVFLGTPPTSVSVKPGLLARMGGEKNCFVGKYLYSTYDTDNKGGLNIVTVIFPHDAKHPKAKMIRVAGEDYTGAKVDLGNSVTDVAIESAGKTAVKCDKVSFRGLAALYRLKDKANAFYFVRKGKSFNDGAKPRRGFESNADISVYIKDKQGRIISPGAEVTFYYPGIKGVLLDGKAAPIIGSGNGWVKVAVGKGAYDLKFSLK